MVVSVICAVLFASAISMYIAGSVKKINLLEKIPLCLSGLLLAGISIPLLLIKLPDSFHTAVISSIALLSYTVYMTFKNLRLFKRRLPEKLSLIAMYFFWILLFYSVFFIYRIHIPVIIVFGIFYLLVVLFLIIKLHLRTMREIVSVIVISFCSGSLFFISSVTLIYEHSLYSLFCFLGSTGFSIANIITFLNTKKEKPVSPLLENIILSGSSLILLTGSILMLF